MPRHPSLKANHLISGATILVIVGSGLLFFGNHHQSGSLDLKSVRLAPKAGPVLKHTHKMRGPINASIENLNGDQAIVAGKSFTLKASISSTDGLSNAHLKWSLPEGLSLESGAQEMETGPLLQDEVRQVKITLRSLVDENLQIHLQVSGEKNGALFGDTLQFNTTEGELIKIENAELAKRSKDHMEQESKNQKKLQTKVFQ